MKKQIGKKNEFLPKTRHLQRQIKETVGLWCLALLGIFMHSDLVEACEVRLDDGRVKNLGYTFCEAHYDPQHPCSSLSRDDSNGCRTMDMFTIVDWDGVDLINNTHRGVWGVTLPDNIATTNPSPDSVPVGYKRNGAPENTIAGMVASARAGFKSVEFDIFPMVVQGHDNREVIIPVVSHLADLAGFSGYRDEQSITKKAEDSEGFLSSVNRGRVADIIYVRDRNGKLDYVAESDMPYGFTHEDYVEYKFVSLDIFLRYMDTYHPDMVVVLDMKWSKPLSQKRLLRSDSQNPCSHSSNDYANGKIVNKCIGLYEDNTTHSNFSADEQVHRAILQAIQIATDIGEDALSRVIFKVPQARLEDPSQLEPYLPEYLDVNLKSVMWAPQPDASGNAPIVDVIAYVEKWRLWEDKNIAFWDTSVHSLESWMAKPIKLVNDGITQSYAYDPDYCNDFPPDEFPTSQCQEFDSFIDFLIAGGKRPAIWVIDPAGPLGRHGNYGMSWANYGNNSNDRRGDVQGSLAFPWAKNAVYTTDRPLTVLQLRTALKQRHGINFR